MRRNLEDKRDNKQEEKDVKRKVEEEDKKD
jgi:hypothetical protein